VRPFLHQQRLLTVTHNNWLLPAWTSYWSGALAIIVVVVSFPRDKTPAAASDYDVLNEDDNILEMIW